MWDLRFSRTFSNPQGMWDVRLPRTFSHTEGMWDLRFSKAFSHTHRMMWEESWEISHLTSIAYVRMSWKVSHLASPPYVRESYSGENLEVLLLFAVEILKCLRFCCQEIYPKSLVPSIQKTFQKKMQMRAHLDKTSSRASLSPLRWEGEGWEQGRLREEIGKREDSS